jgi:Flp pilus assembly protein TadG
MTVWSNCRARSSQRPDFISASPPPAIGRSPRSDLLERFWRDESGTYVLVVALLTPMLIGVAGLGTEVVWWLYKHKNMQGAADSGAVSAATAGMNLSAEANSVTAAFGYANGANGVMVTVNQPPSSGNYTATPQAVEVLISQPQQRLLSALFGTDPVVISARSVALGNSGTGCVLALDPTASPSVAVKGGAQLSLINCNLYDNSGGGPALTVTGTASVSANMVSSVGTVSGASSITATSGIRTGVRPQADPYASFSPPAMPSCDPSNYTVNSNGKTTSLSPGCYSGNITVNAGASLTLDPGIYYVNAGNLSVAGNATLSGTGVTLVFTGYGTNHWGTASIGSNANVNLTAPTSGPTQGIVMYGDRNMQQGTAFSLTGGSTQSFNGAIYLPQAALSYSGGNGTTTSCTKIIADTITFTGNSNVQVNCAALGTGTIGTQTAQLVE